MLSPPWQPQMAKADETGRPLLASLSAILLQCAELRARQLMGLHCSTAAAPGVATHQTRIRSFWLLLLQPPGWQGP